MTRLRRVLVAPRAPDARTPQNLALVAAAEPLSAELEARLAATPVDARYRALGLMLEPVRDADGAVHWRIFERPTAEAEFAFAAVPADLPLDAAGRVRLLERLVVAVLGELARLRGWPHDALLALVAGLGEERLEADPPLVLDPPELWS